MANFFESGFTVLQELAKEQRTMDAMKELKEYIFIPEKYFKQLYQAQNNHKNSKHTE